jgi:hypothetical protein
MHATPIDTLSLWQWWSRLVVERKIAEADRFAVARPIDDEAGDAARDEIAHALEVLDLLRHVEAVEVDERRRAARCALGMDEERGETRALVRNLDVLDARSPDAGRRITEAVDARL